MSVFGRDHAGNDVLDLALARERGPLEGEWMERHLTPEEARTLRGEKPRRRERHFWRFFASKEAADKAFAQAGLATPRGGFATLQVDLEGQSVIHLASGRTAELSLREDDEAIHAVALLRERDGPSATLLSEVSRLPAGQHASDYVRERLVQAVFALTGLSPKGLEVGSVDGIPRLLAAGRWLDWSVSLSHAGRFAAWTCVAPNLST